MGTASQVAPSPDAGAKRRVLLVDDMVDLRSLVRRMVEREGDFVVVGEAGDGLEGVELAGELQPDLVVLDLSMPRMDGLEALPLIRLASPTSTVVILSGFESASVREEAQRRGAHDVLDKGRSPSELVDALRRAIGPWAPPIATSDDPGGPPGIHLTGEDLVRVVAHDIRGPLAAIRLAADMLGWEGEGQAPPLPVLVDVLERQAAVIEELCTNLLDVGVIERGAVAVSLSVERTDELLNELVVTVRPLAAGHPLDLTIGPDLPDVVVDRARLRQVLANLVQNAARSSPPGAAIELSVGASDDGVLVSVTDQGPGIPPEQRANVFSKFVRLRADGPGSGLGLFICDGVVRAMGGRIWIDDPPEGGCRVCCWLPAAA